MFLFRLIIPTRDLFACRPEAYHLAQFIIHSRRFGETTVVAYCEKRLVSLLVGSGESGQGSLRREIVRAEIDDSWKDVLANFANFVVSPVPRFASFINRPCAHARAIRYEEGESDAMCRGTNEVARAVEGRRGGNG